MHFLYEKIDFFNLPEFPHACNFGEIQFSQKF